MQKKVFTFALTAVFILNACNETQKKDNNVSSSEIAKTNTDTIVTSSATDKYGNTLEMSFNNAKDNATVKFNGETIELIGQKPASGIWYKNDNYELRGKGNDVTLTKKDKTIFEYIEDVDSKDSNSSVHVNKNIETTNEVAWWENRFFVNNRPVSNNPELGGPDFLKINRGNTAEYKVGDIAEQMTWSYSDNKLKLENAMTKRKVLFKVGNLILTDEFGTKWTIKKQ